ncbi:MAG: cadherin repeat domain-containing protein [Sedimentisphaerales bacterium]|nr:cadherin repeat domain-containing protein [Sedimentisphaerales bacterium]
MLLICVLAFLVCVTGCARFLKKEEPVEEIEPVEVPASGVLTLSDQQLLLLDWNIGYSQGAHVRNKRIVPGQGVEFDIFFPSNSADCRSLDVVSSGEGGKGSLVGGVIRDCESFALKLTLVSINGESDPDTKQKLVVGALIGPTSSGQLSTYEPVTMSLSASERAVVAETSVSAEKIYQIGFHLHMQNPQEWDSSASIVRLMVEPVIRQVDVNDVTSTVPGNMAANQYPVTEPYSASSANGAPVITSEPVTTACADLIYRYDVNAIDPDPGDTLTYSLVTKPAGMNIDPVTGLILWRPMGSDRVTDEKVIVKVADSYSIPATATQSFTITIEPTPFRVSKLSVQNGYSQGSRRTLLSDGTIKLLGASDNRRSGTSYGLFTSFDFSDISIPPDTLIRSVVVYIEHFEQSRFGQGRLEWSIGSGWPFRKKVLASINAPIHIGESNETVDSWDITSLIDSSEKLNSLQLEVKNNNVIANTETLIDYIYVVIMLE